MKNLMKKRIIMIWLVITLSFASFTSVYAKSGETVTLDNKGYIQSGVASRTEAKFHTTMGYGWCITPQKVGAKQGAVLIYSNEETDGGVLYLLDKTGTSDTEYLVTQIALWSYYSNFMPTAYSQNSSATVVRNAKDLAAIAKKNSNYKVDPSIAIDRGDLSIKLVKNGDNYYYRTSSIGVNLVDASTYQVVLKNAPSGAVVVDENGTATSTFNASDKFMVRIPEASISEATKMTISVKATGVRKFVERYKPSSSDLQDLVILRKEKKTVTSDLTVKVNPIKKYCEHFNGKYYGSDGSIVTEQEYRSQCIHTCTQYNGNWYGSNGTIVTEQEYKNQCVHTCTQYNGNYYGINSTIVTEQEYRNQCVHTCTQYNGKYYGSNSTIVTEQEYRNQCVHTCTQYNGNYYGLNGTIVTEQEYKNQCFPTVVSVPNTGSNNDGTNVLAGSLIILGGLGMTLGFKKTRKN